MLQYVLLGSALGSIYAIASASPVVIFVSAGVLVFAFGSQTCFGGLAWHGPAANAGSTRSATTSATS